VKLSDLRPCDFCNGPVGFCFRVITIALAVVNRRAVQEAVGFHAMGWPLGLTEAMGAHASSGDPVAVAEDNELVTRLFACQDCYATKLSALAVAAEARDAETAAGEGSA